MLYHFGKWRIIYGNSISIWIQELLLAANDENAGFLYHPPQINRIPVKGIPASC